MGHPGLATPRLDRLAAESVTFQRGYTPVPLCRPSLSSIVTGLYPHQHGVTGNDPQLPDAGVNAMTARANPKYARYYETLIGNFSRQPNLVRDLVSGGYVALQTGKWWEGDPVKTAGFTRAMTQGETRGSRHGDAGLAIGREGLDPVYRFIEQAGGKPFFVWYAPMLPHAPHTPPDDLLQKYLKVAPSEPVARYWACVEWFDRTCGELLDYLDQKGLRENTIVIYTCDNGWIQNPDKANQFAPRSKLTPYEGGVRTPIMICWPGKLKPRMDKEHLASNVDLWPTLGALLKIAPPKNLPGIDLTNGRAVARRSRIFGEQYAHNVADVDDPTRSLQHRWIIEGWWKLIVPRPTPEPSREGKPTSGPQTALPSSQGLGVAPSGKSPELYNLRDDPWEKNDLAANEAARVKKLGRQLDAWWKPR